MCHLPLALNCGVARDVSVSMGLFRKPHLTFAVAATSALLAALLIDHGIVAAVGTEVAADGVLRHHHRVQPQRAIAAVASISMTASAVARRLLPNAALPNASRSVREAAAEFEKRLQPGR